MNKFKNLVSTEFNPSQLEYLYSPATYPVWEAIANFIKQQGSRKILDVGSSYGCPRMLDLFLHDYEYEYFGLDISESLVAYATEIYKDKLNVSFIHASWDDITIDAQYDCMLLLGILPYGMNNIGYYEHSSPWDLYTYLKDKFNTRQIIIKETDGDEWKGIKLMDLEPFEKIASDVQRFDISGAYSTEDAVLGKKVVYNVITS